MVAKAVRHTVDGATHALARQRREILYLETRHAIGFGRAGHRERDGVVGTRRDTCGNRPSFWHVVDEIHITNLAVHPDLRRRGFGRNLIQEVRKFAESSRAKRLLLEVRRSNFSAQNLYRELGFSPIGVRRGYYEDTSEDALVMELILP